MVAGAGVIVVGGTGFVGTAVCTHFRERGYLVVSVARHPARRPGIRDVALDVVTADPSTIRALIEAERPVAIVNAAGAVWDCTERQMRQLNVVLVRRLLSAIVGSRHPLRFVQLGSVHEYGIQPTGASLVESAPARPNTPYGWTKLRATEAVLDAARTGRVAGLVLRVTNAVGVGAPPSSLTGRVAAELARADRAGVPATLTLSRLRAQRDFVDIRDVADAAARAIGVDATGEIINVGSGRPMAVRSVVDRLIQISGVPTTLRETAAEETIRSSRLDWQQAGIERARHLLGWQARRSLDESLRDLWESVRAPAASSAEPRRVL